MPSSPTSVALATGGWANVDLKSPAARLGSPETTKPSKATSCSLIASRSLYCASRTLFDRLHSVKTLGTSNQFESCVMMDMYADVPSLLMIDLKLRWRISNSTLHPVVVNRQHIERPCCDSGKIPNRRKQRQQSDNKGSAKTYPWLPFPLFPLFPLLSPVQSSLLRPGGMSSSASTCELPYQHLAQAHLSH